MGRCPIAPPGLAALDLLLVHQRNTKKAIDGTGGIQGHRPARACSHGPTCCWTTREIQKNQSIDLLLDHQRNTKKSIDGPAAGPPEKYKKINRRTGWDPRATPLAGLRGRAPCSSPCARSSNRRPGIPRNSTESRTCRTCTS